MDGPSIPSWSRLLQMGREAWPGIELTEDTFKEWLEKRSVGPARAADHYIACACAAGDRRALSEFDRRYLRHADGALTRIDPSPAFADDVRQRLREKLFVARDGDAPAIAGYTGKGSLENWVRAVAVRVALDLVRSPKPESSTEDEVLAAIPASGDDLELKTIKARYRREFKDAFQKALDGLSARERNVLRLHFVDGLNIQQIGELYKTHRATVARWIAGSRKSIERSTRRTLSEKLDLSEMGLTSVVDLVSSQLDVSISRLLRRTED